MANIILPAVPVLSEIDDSAKLLIEQAGEINRYPISDLDIGGGDVTIDLSGSSDTNGSNSINADTLGGKPASDYVLKDELILDSIDCNVDLSGYATNDYVNQQVKKAAPRNLLDNSDFRNPVVQAGLGGAHGSRIYVVDRWIFNGSSESAQYLSLNEVDGLYFPTGYTIYQKMPIDIVTNKHTFVIWLSDGTVESVVISKNYTALGSSGYSVCHNAENTVYINNVASETSIKHVALYEGEYTVETLPNYQPKGYGVELAECQRYYQCIAIGASKHATAVSDALYVDYFFHTPMRIHPTVTFVLEYNYSDWVTDVTAKAIRNGTITLTYTSSKTTYDFYGVAMLSADL